MHFLLNKREKPISVYDCQACALEHCHLSTMNPYLKGQKTKKLQHSCKTLACKNTRYASMHALLARDYNYLALSF